MTKNNQDIINHYSFLYLLFDTFSWRVRPFNYHWHYCHEVLNSGKKKNILTPEPHIKPCLSCLWMRPSVKASHWIWEDDLKFYSHFRSFSVWRQKPDVTSCFPSSVNLDVEEVEILKSRFACRNMNMNSSERKSQSEREKQQQRPWEERSVHGRQPRWWTETQKETGKKEGWRAFHVTLISLDPHLPLASRVTSSDWDDPRCHGNWQNKGDTPLLSPLYLRK